MNKKYVLSMLLLFCVVTLSNAMDRAEQEYLVKEAVLLAACSKQCCHRLDAQSDKEHVCEQKSYLVKISRDNHTIGVLSLLQMNKDTAIFLRGSALQIEDRTIVYSQGLLQIKTIFPKIRKVCTTTCHEGQKDIDAILKNNNFQECSASKWPKDILPPNPGQKGYVLELMKPSKFYRIRQRLRDIFG